MMMIDHDGMVRSAMAQDRIDSKVPASVTAEGKALLLERVDDLRGRRLPELVSLLTEEERDERVVAEYEAILIEIAEWEAFLAEAELIVADAALSDGAVALGVRTLVGMADGSEEWVRPVHPREAFLDGERISVTSPLGSAIIGARPGDRVHVDAPAGAWECTVHEVESTVSRSRSRRRSSRPKR